MEPSLKTQSALLDAIYSAAIRPSDYIAFTKVWDATIARIAEQDKTSSLKLHAEALELRKHFNRAFEVFEKSRLGRRQNIQEYLDRQASAAAACLENGEIIACNAHFTAQFQIAVGGSFSALRDRLIPVRGSNGGTQSIALSATGDEPGVYRIDDGDASHSILVVERLKDSDFPDADLQPIFLVRSNMVQWSDKVGAFLIANFALTPAEVDIAKLLLVGMRSEEIAVLRRRSKGTVRQQIKTIMEKTEATTQVALVTLLISLHHLLAARIARGSEETVHLSEPDRIHTTVIADSPLWGTIEYDRYGAPDGGAVAFFHSEMSSARPTPAMIDAMAAQKLMVFAPRKPGLGATTLERQATDPKGFVSAFVNMLASKGVRTRALVGQGMSGVAVIDFAASDPDATDAVVTINTGIPYTSSEQFDHFPPVAKRIFWTIWEAPELFYAPFAFASEAMRASPESERAFMTHQFSDIPHDQNLIEDPAFYAVAVQSMRDFMSTPKRSADDLVYWMHDWTEALRTVAKRMPMLFLQSEYHNYLKQDPIADYLEPYPKARAGVLPKVALLGVVEKPAALAKKIASVLKGAR